MTITVLTAVDHYSLKRARNKLNKQFSNLTGIPINRLFYARDDDGVLYLSITMGNIPREKCRYIKLQHKYIPETNDKNAYNKLKLKLDYTTLQEFENIGVSLEPLPEEKMRKCTIM